MKADAAIRGMAMAALPFVAVTAFAQSGPPQCPENSTFLRYEHRGDRRITHCECNAGYVKKQGRCAPAPLAGFTGTWNDREKQIVNESLRGVEDAALRAWIKANVQLNRYKADNVSPVTASGSSLRFRDRYFTELSSAARDNLLAFEAGKVFWETQKDKPLPGGGTLLTWFVGYAGSNDSVIGAMKEAKHRNQSLAGVTTDLIDTPSAFGHAFRAQALQLSRPSGAMNQQRWDSAMRDFRNHIEPLLERHSQ